MSDLERPPVAARRDLTSGSIPRGILSLAVPMIASSVLHSVQSLVDMKFVGKLGPEAIAAVGMSGQAIWILITVFMGLSVSTVAMISRAVGAEDEARASHVVGQSLILTVVLSVLVGGVGFIASRWVLEILGAEPEVVDLGTGYLHTIFSGIFFLCAAFILSGILYGAGDALTPLLLGVLTTALNVVLNPIFIFGWGWFPAMGVRGSALATVAARVVSLSVGAWVLFSGRLRVKVAGSDFAPSPATMWRMIAIGVPGAAQMMIRSLMGLVLMRIVAQFGTVVVAAYAVGMRVRMLGLVSSFSLGGAAATMVGQNLGADKPERSSTSAYVAAGMAGAVACVVALAFFVFAPQLVAFFNAREDVVAAGSPFLRITALGLVTASIGIVLGRAMNGAGDTISPLVISLFALWGFQIPAAVYLSGVSEIWGVAVPMRSLFGGLATGSETGIWYAMIAASVLQAAITAGWFSTGMWRRRKV